MSKNIIIELPLFTGFYNSIHSGTIESLEEQYMEYNDIADYDTLLEEYTIDYKTIYKEYAKDYVDWFFSEFGEEILKATWINITKFIKIISPKYYNYSTDTIDVEIECDKEKLMAFIEWEWEDFIKYIKGSNTSSDWFIPFITNDIKEYKTNIIQPNKITQILQYFINKKNYSEYTVIENMEVLEIFESNISSK